MPVATPPPVAHAAAAGRLDRAIVRQINTVRARHGRAPVVLSTRLRRLARHHTLDMLRHDSFSHDGDGTTFAQRIHARVHFRKVGENLALMPRGAGAGRIVRAWMHSPPHRAVLLDPAYHRVGVAGANGNLGAGSAYVVTADFATWR
jgi:uncharacterized protein YkwD